MPDAPVTSGDMIFKPEVARRFADCGITFLDEPTDVIPMALLYLGHDPNSLEPRGSRRRRDAAQGRASLHPLFQLGEDAHRPAERGSLHRHELVRATTRRPCERAAEVGRPVKLAYTMPREGTVAWFDLWFIPADAPHPDNAHLFLNYLLRPEVIAAISNETRYAAPNPKAMPFVLPEVRDDPAVYPPEDRKQRLYKGYLHDPKEERRGPDSGPGSRPVCELHRP